MTTLRPSIRSFVIFTVALGFVLSSCDGSSQHDGMPPDEAADRIVASMNDLGDQLKTLEEGRFSSATKTFLGLENGTATAADWSSRLLSELDAITVKTDHFFYVETSTGEFAWDGSNQKWVTEGAAEDLILHFPLEEGAGNDATFTLRIYSQKELTVDQDPVVVPTEIDASASVKNTEIFAVRLWNVRLGTNDRLNQPIPESLSLTLFTAPYTHRLEVTKRSLASYDLSYELHSDDELVAGLSANAVVTLNSEEPLGLRRIEELVGQAQIGSHLVVPFSLEPRAVAEAEDPSQETFNDHLDASVRYRDQDAANLRYNKSADNVEFVYSDGSTDVVSQRLSDFIHQMKDVWSTYPGPTSVSSTAKSDTSQ